MGFFWRGGCSKGGGGGEVGGGGGGVEEGKGGRVTGGLGCALIEGYSIRGKESSSSGNCQRILYVRRNVRIDDAVDIVKLQLHRRDAEVEHLFGPESQMKIDWTT